MYGTSLVDIVAELAYGPSAMAANYAARGSAVPAAVVHSYLFIQTSRRMEGKLGWRAASGHVSVEIPVSGTDERCGNSARVAATTTDRRT